MTFRRQQLQLAPTKEQARALRQCEGLSRYAWNWLMRQVIASLDKHEKVDFKRLTRKGFHEHVKNEATWALELPLRPAWEALTHCQQAWFRHWKSPQKYGRPRWRAKRLTGSCHVGINPKFVNGQICVSPKNLGWIKLAHDNKDQWMPPSGSKLKLATLKLHAGRYFVSVLYRFEQLSQITSYATVAIDLGVAEAVTADSTGAIKRHKLSRPLKRKHRRVAILQRRLQRKRKGSRRRLACCRKINTLHWRIANTRRHFCHQLSHDLSRRYRMVVIEDLKVSRLLRESPTGLSRNIADAAWSSLRQMLTYKVGEMGGTLIVADQWYPSSQLCTQCGARSGPLPLNVRTPQCATCGHTEDRDVRAAKNLLNLAPHGGVLRAWRAAAPDEAPTGAGVSSN